MFMSRNALKGIHPQTCLDDLESFYYVLLYITRRHMGPTISRGLPSPLNDWDHQLAASMKHGFLSHKFEYAIDPQLGKPFQALVGRLHSVFKDMLFAELFADHRGEPPPVVNHDEIYDKMLSYVREAIEELNREIHDGVTTPFKSSHEEPKMQDGTPSSVESWSKIPACKKIVRTLATDRARRNKAGLRMSEQVRVKVRIKVRIKVLF